MTEDKVESLEKRVIITNFKEGQKKGLRVRRLAAKPTEAEVFIDYYAIENNEIGILVSRITVIHPEERITDFYKHDKKDSSNIMRIVYQCAMEEAKVLAKQLNVGIEDLSGYSNGGSKDDVRGNTS